MLAATFGGGEGGDPIDRAELFATWRSAIELGAQARPLVVVVEDLHWSSDSLLDLIEVILQPRGDAPLLMIALARPELLDRRPTWGGGRRNYLSVALEPLDDLAISALVDFLLGAPPPEVVETIVARSGGNPFFAGELARTIRERAIPLDDRMAVQAVVASLPDTVHGAVLARLDLLPPGPRRLIQLGSIFGRSFTAGGVLALAPELASSVDPDVDHLLEHDLLRAGASDELVFRHILIREVGYQTMPRAERARLHAAAAAWLAGRAVGREEEDAELVAFHFREAVTLAGAAGIDLGPDIHSHRGRMAAPCGRGSERRRRVRGGRAAHPGGNRVRPSGAAPRSVDRSRRHLRRWGPGRGCVRHSGAAGARAGPSARVHPPRAQRAADGARPMVGLRGCRDLA